MLVNGTALNIIVPIVAEQRRQEAVGAVEAAQVANRMEQNLAVKFVWIMAQLVVAPVVIAVVTVLALHL